MRREDSVLDHLRDAATGGAHFAVFIITTFVVLGFAFLVVMGIIRVAQWMAS